MHDLATIQRMNKEKCGHPVDRLMKSDLPNGLRVVTCTECHKILSEVAKDRLKEELIERI